MTARTTTSPYAIDPHLLERFSSSLAFKSASIKQAPISTKQRFEAVQIAMQSPRAVSATIAAIDDVVKNLDKEIASSNESHNRYNPDALLLHSVCIPKKEVNRLYQTLDLYSSLTIERERSSALEQAISFTKPEHDKKASETLKQARIALNFFEKTRREDAPSFTWKYVQSCLEKLHPPQINYSKEPLGKGAEATVYEAEIDSHWVAVKKFHKTHPDKNGLTKSEAEADITIDLDHPYIMKPLMVTADCIFYEKARTSLFLLLTEEYILNSVETTRIFRNIAEAMTYLHSLGILHRDLKTDNVLLVKNALGPWVPKLTDFSFACYATNHTKLQQMQGTAIALSRESAVAFLTRTLLENYEKADVYSVGVMIFDLLCDYKYHSPIKTDKHLYGDFFNEPTTQDILKIRAEYPHDLTKEHLEPLLDPRKRRVYDEKGVLFTLMCDCLQDDFERRPDMADIVKRLS